MATLAAAPPHGLVPAFNVKPNGLPDGASKEIADTFNAAVPVLRIVTSNGAGTLFGRYLAEVKGRGQNLYRWNRRRQRCRSWAWARIAAPAPAPSNRNRGCGKKQSR